MTDEINPGIFNGIYIPHMDQSADGAAPSMLDRHPHITGKPRPTRVGAGNELAISAHSIIESGVSVTASVADRPIILDLNDVTNPNIANIRSMIKAVTSEMQDDPQMAQMLLQSGDFGIEERLAWEKKLAEQIAKTVDKDPNFGTIPRWYKRVRTFRRYQPFVFFQRLRVPSHGNSKSRYCSES